MLVECQVFREPAAGDDDRELEVMGRQTDDSARVLREGSFRFCSKKEFDAGQQAQFDSKHRSPDRPY